jgi:hypothetical protein
VGILREHTLLGLFIVVTDAIDVGPVGLFIVVTNATDVVPAYGRHSGLQTSFRQVLSRNPVFLKGTTGAKSWIPAQKHRRNDEMEDRRNGEMEDRQNDEMEDHQNGEMEDRQNDEMEDHQNDEMEDHRNNETDDRTCVRTSRVCSQF